MSKSKKVISTAFLFSAISVHTQLNAVSMVYNFRIAQLTKQPIFTKTHANVHSVVILPFNTFYRKYNGHTQNYAGGLASYIIDIDHYYARVDMAAAHISAHANHELIYHGQAADDILLSLGYNLIVSPNITTVTFSGLVGIPTHGIDILKHPDFGYGQASIGAQVDGSTAINHLTNIIYGARYIHFIPRNTFDRAFIRHKFSIGNIFDILLAFKQTWTHHGYEFGYTARFNYGARCAPFFDDIIKRTNYIRSNLYAVYKYKFMVGPYANRFLLDVGFGRDHSPKLYGNKYIVTVWGSWQINF